MLKGKGCGAKENWLIQQNGTNALKLREKKRKEHKIKSIKELDNTEASEKILAEVKKIQCLLCL